ncbi:MAG TPA: hypothetical protein VMK32_05270 [Burkholderiaceae bacterium]|nr:hypothetical protein [Burkholderiaceae bacterium]
MASEHGRIGFLLQRDGAAATIEWVRRTLCIYRHALRDRAGYGGEFRRPIIESCCEFRHWLRRHDLHPLRSENQIEA